MGPAAICGSGDGSLEPVCILERGMDAKEAVNVGGGSIVGSPGGLATQVPVYSVGESGLYQWDASADADSVFAQELVAGPTNSLWFCRFTQGMSRRMGAVTKSDMALSIPILLRFMEVCKQEAQSRLGHEQALYVGVGAYVVTSFCASLRGNEGFMMDLAGLRKYLDCGRDEGENSHVVVPLLGQFKGETGDRYHLIPVVSVTASGLRPRYWLEQLVKVRECQGFTSGPAFCDENGRCVKSKVYQTVFHDLLEDVKFQNPELFTVDSDIREDYGISRSMRRGSATRATEAGVSATVIDLINRWRTVERAEGGQPVFRMREHYSEIRALMTKLLEYSRLL